MNHISGNVGQTVEVEHGPFINLGQVRFRRNMITGYLVEPVPGAKPEDQYQYQFTFTSTDFHRAMFVRCKTSEEAEKLASQVDWIFSKEYGKKSDAE